MARVSVQILPWLVKELGFPEESPIALDEEIPDGLTAGELLTQLARKHERFGQVVFDAADQRIHEQVAIVLNDRLLVVHGGLAAQLRDGDKIVLLPGYCGGG